MASVELRGLTKRYDALAVVDNVSLRIEHGLLVCLLGPSGCGKTTTLRLIAGFIEPTAGEIAVGDRVVSSPSRTVPPERRNMSMIFQSYALWPHMTVAENVAYGLKLRNVDRDTVGHKLNSILSTTHLDKLAERYPGELSGGQQQRVALARALIVEPETLLLDEPLSNLDANLREEMRFEVRRLHDQYRYTTVYVTHDQSEAMTTADLIAVMNGGKIEQLGSPEQIYEEPHSEFVARFIGSSNVVKGKSVAEDRIDFAGTPLRCTGLRMTALGLTVFAAPLRAAAPPAEPVTPALIDAAKKEGKVVWYTSVDLPLAERVAKSFEAKYAGIACRVERSGAERVFQRIGQEYGSRIHAVDVVQSSDAAHFIVWKRDGILAAYVPEDVAKHYPAEHKDADGQFATFRAWLSVMGYNTSLVKAEEAPKSFADLLDPKWAGKIVKAHPGYSGTIMTATYQMARDLGWDYLEKLAKQRVMQVQSSADPPKKLALGERAIMADGNEYNMFQLKEKGDPVEIIYPTEGSPLIIGPNGLMKDAPNPNAGKLFQSYCFTPECQQLIIDVGGLRSVHPQTKEKPGRKPFGEIKKLKDDAAGVERDADSIKARYTKLFRV